MNNTFEWKIDTIHCIEWNRTIESWKMEALKSWLKLYKVAMCFFILMFVSLSVTRRVVRGV